MVAKREFPKMVVQGRGWTYRNYRLSAKDVLAHDRACVEAGRELSIPERFLDPNEPPYMRTRILGILTRWFPSRTSRRA